MYVFKVYIQNYKQKILVEVLQKTIKGQQNREAFTNTKPRNVESAHISRKPTQTKHSD